jgi:hypothetical protein
MGRESIIREVAAHEGDVERHEQQDLRDEHHHGDREGGNELGGDVAVGFEELGGALLPVGEAEGQQHEVLREQEHTEADVGALLAKELRQFAAELEEEHDGVEGEG